MKTTTTNKELKDKQKAVVYSLTLRGVSVANAAKEVGISERTAYKYLQEVRDNILIKRGNVNATSRYG